MCMNNSNIIELLSLAITNKNYCKVKMAEIRNTTAAACASKQTARQYHDVLEEVCLIDYLLFSLTDV